MKRNFKSTIAYFSRFMGLNTDCVDQLKIEEEFTTMKIVPLENRRIGFEFTDADGPKVLTPEQIYAAYLLKVMKYYHADGIFTNELVLSVPSYFSNVERQAVLDAAEIAGLKCLRIINESTAIGLSYGFFRKMELDETVPRTVAFVDYGHSKLTVTISQFTKNKMKVLFHDSERNVGARCLDSILADKLGAEFNEKYGCDPRKNARTRLRLLDGIEKQRKILSANTEATVHLESLMEDEDLH